MNQPAPREVHFTKTLKRFICLIGKTKLLAFSEVTVKVVGRALAECSL